ncbi:MAG TPA: hypothetical protein VIC84_09335 [Blastocatellia bacterium]|jgi:thymidylate kinase
MSAHLKGLIVEGVVASGKTTLIQNIQLALAEKYPACTKVFLSEHYTERVLEDKKAQRALTASEVIEHADSILSIVKQLAWLKSSSKFEMKTGNALIHVILERLVGSHFANLSTLGAWGLNSHDHHRIRDLYAALAELGFTVLILTIAEDRIEETIDRTRTRRNNAWSDYLNSIGDRMDVGRYYREWQQLLLQFYESLNLVCPIRQVEVAPSKDNLQYRHLADEWIRSS